MKSLKFFVAAAALTVSGAAVAGAPWSYIDLGLNTADSGDERTTGLGLRGSFGFANIWHVGLGIEANEWNGGKGKIGGVDETAYDIWVGLHPAVTDNTDLVVDLGYASSEFELTGAKDDVTALYLRTGPRALLAGDKLEIYGYLVLAAGDNKLTNPSTDWTGVGATVGGQFYFTPAFSLGAEADINGAASPATVVTSADQLKIFLRYSFGQR